MIELTDWLRDELVRRAEAEAPQEACGLVSALVATLGEGRPAISLWAAENAAEEPETSFAIDPEEQTSILTQMWKRKEDLIGVYHSHPHSGPEPSERDRAIAAGHPRPLIWVIVSTCGALPDFWVGELP